MCVLLTPPHYDSQQLPNLAWFWRAGDLKINPVNRIHKKENVLGYFLKERKGPFECLFYHIVCSVCFIKSKVKM